jgi:hypothetical protein
VGTKAQGFKISWGSDSASFHARVVSRGGSGGWYPSRELVSWEGAVNSLLLGGIGLWLSCNHVCW